MQRKTGPVQVPPRADTAELSLPRGSAVQGNPPISSRTFKGCAGNVQSILHQLLRRQRVLQPEEKGFPRLAQRALAFALALKVELYSAAWLLCGWFRCCPVLNTLAWGRRRASLHAPPRRYAAAVPRPPVKKNHISVWLVVCWHVC